jgi:hypothetical protein
LHSDVRELLKLRGTIVDLIDELRERFPTDDERTIDAFIADALGGEAATV